MRAFVDLSNRKLEALNSKCKNYTIPYKPHSKHSFRSANSNPTPTESAQLPASTHIRTDRKRNLHHARAVLHHRRHFRTRADNGACAVTVLRSPRATGSHGMPVLTCTPRYARWRCISYTSILDVRSFFPTMMALLGRVGRLLWMGGLDF